MRASYDRETDILTIELSKRSVDHAKELGSIIVHFAEDEEPVLLEILEASGFLEEATELVSKNSGERFRKMRDSA